MNTSMANRTGIRVAVIDDHEVVRVGLKSLIDLQPDLSVVVACATGREALAVVPHAADVVVMDLRLPDLDGFVLCRHLLQQDPTLQIIILTSFERANMAHDVAAAGARGYLLKEARGHAVITGIRQVMQNQWVCPPPYPPASAPEPSDFARRFETLTPREKAVLTGLSRGQTNAQIGQTLGLSELTVKDYVSHLLLKMRCARRIEVARLFHHFHRLPSEVPDE